MKDLTKLVDTTKVATVASSSVPWKERIVNFLLDQKDHRAPIKTVLEKTDEKHDPAKYLSRKHCLDSQKTYMKQYLNVHAGYDGDDMYLIGLEDKKTGKVHPFVK
jgi:hypothetical protein